MTNIKKIIIPTSLTNIDPNKLPKSIESIEIKNGNKTLLYENGFLYHSSQTLIMCCSKEKDITVPKGIKTIGALSFKQATNVENVVFDFEDTRFMDSSGIGIIMGRYRKISCFGGHVYAIHTDRQIQRIFRMSGLHKIVEILPG